jgi:hypothetical protein
MVLKFVASVALALHPAAHDPETAGCKRTFTVPMAVRAIDATYSPGRPATAAQTARLQRYIRCQRNPAAKQYLLHAWKDRSTPAPMDGPAIASWYDDAGGTGCGFHATYGIATLIAPCGARVRICNGSTCIVATRDDSGPYVSGRTFDLDPTSRAALGCGGLCSVRWRLLQ